VNRRSPIRFGGLPPHSSTRYLPCWPRSRSLSSSSQSFHRPAA